MRGEASEAAPPHAPERGWTARRLGRFHVTGVFWFRLNALAARRSEWLLAGLVPLFTLFFFLTLRRIRSAVAANLEAMLGPCNWVERQRRIWRTFYSFAWSLAERYESLQTDREFTVEVDGREHWDGLSESGQGFILLTAHVGNWEMASALPATRDGRRVHVVREEELDPRAQTFVEDLLERHRGTGYVTHFAAVDPRLGLALREALERGELVALQGDRPRRGGRAVGATLFGRPYPMPPGPLALARQTGAPLLPTFVCREGRRQYRVRFQEPHAVGIGRDRRRDLAAAAQRFAQELEAAVRRHPHQWFVFRPLWNRGGEPGPGGR